MLKIAVYTICKNEEQFVQRFMNCIKDEADGIFVLDTGSTDKTVELLQAQGAVVNIAHINPWRFDVARNVSLSFVPTTYDVCVCIDLDEVFDPGWRAAIEEEWVKGTTTRLRYQYTWSHNADGSPGLTYWYDKITARDLYRWVKPVHEVLTIPSGAPEVQAYSHKIKLHHWPDQTKSRGSYLPLLELAVQEQSDDDRSSHYLGREYSFYGKHDDTIRELTRHLALPTARWKPERAASMRLLSKAFKAKQQVDEAFSWIMKACAEAPGEREPWVELLQLCYEQQDWGLAYGAAKKALAIVERPLSYICEASAWGSQPWDLLSIAAWHLGHKEEALAAAKQAISFSPNDQRILANITFMSK